MSSASQTATAAIGQTERNANDYFIYLAMVAGRHLARTNQEINSIMIRDLMHKKDPHITTHEDRVLGAIMRKLAKDSYIVRTDRTKKSGKSSNHNRDIRIWSSLVYDDRT